MTAGSGILHQEMPKGDAAGPDARLPAVGEPPASLKMTRAPLPGRRRAGHPRGRGRRWDAGARHLRRLLGQNRSRGRGRGRPALSRRVGAARASARRLAVETSRHAFAYVFAGSGTFRDASEPRAVLTERSGAGRQPRCPRRSATGRSCCSTAATRSSCRRETRASGSCWCRASRSRSRWRGTADRHEHRGGAAAGLRGAARRHLHPSALSAARPVLAGLENHLARRRRLCC